MARVLLPPNLSSVPTARHWVAATYAELAEQGRCGPGVEVAVLELLTTEAVANAVLHGAGQVGVQLSCEEQVVRVAVSDTSPVVPVVRRRGPEVVGGHGMALIDTLSTRWGVQTPAPAGPGLEADAGAATGVVGGGSAGAGKSVWFELGAGG